MLAGVRDKLNKVLAAEAEKLCFENARLEERANSLRLALIESYQQLTALKSCLVVLEARRVCARKRCRKRIS